MAGHPPQVDEYVLLLYYVFDALLVEQGTSRLPQSLRSLHVVIVLGHDPPAK